jgi:hypothetical protein
MVVFNSIVGERWMGYGASDLLEDPEQLVYYEFMLQLLRIFQ